MDLKRSIYARLIWRFLPIILIVLLVQSAYWAIYWECFVWGKSLAESLNVSLRNWVIFFGSFLLLAVRVFFNHRETNEPGLSKESNPFLVSAPKKKVEDKTSFNSYVQEKVRGFDEHTRMDFGWVGRKKIHMRFLRQVKRLMATMMFFLYFVLGLGALPNPIAFLFFLTCFLQLDYLWKSRRVSLVEAPK